MADQLARPDHLFLNAGVMSAPHGASDDKYAFKSVDLETYRKIVGVNVDGVVFGVKHLAPAMEEGSSIVVTASLAGIYGYPHDPLYAMTKHAVVGLVKSLAPELAQQGIRLSALCPNRVVTDLLPKEKRHLDCLQPETVAQDVIRLMETGGAGEIWVRVDEDEAMHLVNRRRRRHRWIEWSRNMIRHR
jgi:NAD(P)-dependent dehydrogenase (short-subunit alcohol dehydrogenase family)